MNPVSQTMINPWSQSCYLETTGNRPQITSASASNSLGNSTSHVAPNSVSSSTPPAPVIEQNHVHNGQDCNVKRIMSIAQALKLSKVSFTAMADDDPDKFIRQLQDSKLNLQLTDDDIFRCLSSILSAKALDWYHLERRNWRNYTDFLTAFHTQYDVINYQGRLLLEAQLRYQGRNENITDFLTSIRTIFAKMIPELPLENQLDIAYKNLNPEYITQIFRNQFMDFAQLRNFGKMIELRNEQRNQYRDPPDASKCLIKSAACPPEARGSPRQNKNPAKGKSALAATVKPSTVSEKSPQKSKDAKQSTNPPPKSSNNSPKKESKTGNHNQKQKQNAPAEKLGNSKTRSSRPARTATDDDKCFKCEQLGHFWQDCTNDGPDTFCYKCGLHGVTYTTCTNCHPNLGNGTPD